MKIGVLDILVDSPRTWINFAYRGVLKKQYASIVPQAVAVWCRQLGHEVAYAAYYGQRDPKRLLPDDLDVVFLSTYTQSSALAYALAKLYRRDGILTVIGGPHARSFPADCLRFFDFSYSHSHPKFHQHPYTDSPRYIHRSTAHACHHSPAPCIHPRHFLRLRPPFYLC